MSVEGMDDLYDRAIEELENKLGREPTQVEVEKWVEDYISNYPEQDEPDEEKI